MPPMDKRQLIDDIRKHNITAKPEFLDQFDGPALKQYLDHLEEAHAKRVRFAGMPRPLSQFKLVS